MGVVAAQDPGPGKIRKKKALKKKDGSKSKDRNLAPQVIQDG